MDYIIQLNYYAYLHYNDYIHLLITNRSYYYNKDYNNDLIYKYYLLKKFSNRFVEQASLIVYSYCNCLSSIIVFEKRLSKLGYPLWSEYVYYAYWKTKK